MCRCTDFFRTVRNFHFLSGKKKLKSHWKLFQIIYYYLSPSPNILLSEMIDSLKIFSAEDRCLFSKALRPRKCSIETNLARAIDFDSACLTRVHQMNATCDLSPIENTYLGNRVCESQIKFARKTQKVELFFLRNSPIFSNQNADPKIKTFSISRAKTELMISCINQLREISSIHSSHETHTSWILSLKSCFNSHAIASYLGIQSSFQLEIFSGYVYRWSNVVLCASWTGLECTLHKMLHKLPPTQRFSIWCIQRYACLGLRVKWELYMNPRRVLECVSRVYRKWIILRA